MLKPIDGNDLIKAVEKAKKAMHESGNSSNIGNLLQNVKAPAVQQQIAIPNREGYEFVPVDKITYCGASGAYSEIVLTDNKTIVLSKSLGETEEMLSKELFERIHHSVLVNV